MNPRLRNALIILGLFVAAWLPRVVALDAFVTIDERKWLARSANFTQALSSGELANTFQREHPGVSVMWVGTFGLLNEYPEYVQEAPGQFAWAREEFESWLAENTDQTPLALLAAARSWMALAIALAVTACFWPMRSLLGERIALFTTLYLAWTPFFVGLSRQLHLDGLVSALSLLALLSFLAWLYPDEKGRKGVRSYLLGSGIVMGLAWLTKTPAILLVPTALLLVFIEVIRSLLPNQRITHSPVHLLTSFILWGVTAIVTFYALWPAMQADPLGTLGRMAAEMGDYVEGHVNVNYFWGQPTPDPGLFFYPVAWFFRTTPLTVIGLFGAAVLAWRRRLPFDRPNVRSVSFALLIFAMILTVVLTFTAKKFDRYALPAFVSLAVVASFGWVGLADWMQKWWSAKRVGSPPLAPQSWGEVSTDVALDLSQASEASQTSPKIGGRGAELSNAILAVVVLLHGLLGFAHFPYYLTYYNPLAGGPWTAPHVMFVGWGEGLDQAAEWLNGLPDAENQRTVAWYHDGPLSYFYDGQADAITAGSPMLWLDTDYAVVYINQRQRLIPSPEAVAYFDSLEPVHSVRFRGLDLAQIYDMRDRPLPDFIDIRKEAAADFGGRIRLAAYDFNAAIVQPGEDVQATFYLQAIASVETNYNVLVRLIASDGSELWREEGWPWGAPTAEWPLREIWPDGHTIEIADDAEPGLYKLVVGFYDPETFEPLPVTALGGGEVLHPSERDVALLQVALDEINTSDARPQWQFGDDFGLDATVSESAQPGEALAIQLHWQSLDPTAESYTVFVHVVGPDGEVVAQEDRRPLHGFAPTFTWQQGQRIDDHYAIALPADLALGEYDVHVGLYTSEAGRLLVVENGEVSGDGVVVGKIVLE